MKKITVKACPFCKEELEIVGKGHYFAHKINNGCILQHLCFEIDDEEAVAAWNNRKPVEDVLERLENNSYLCDPTYDIDGYSNDDEQEVILLEIAVEIVKEELGGE